MAAGTTITPSRGPAPEEFTHVFRVYETRHRDDRLVFYGEPLAPRQEILREVWPLFRDAGYEAKITYQTGEYLLVAEPVDMGITGIPWTNIILAVATLMSTLYAGTFWYYVESPLADPLYTLSVVWPFAAGILGILAIHELGHYVMSRYHRVDASLPYFIPIPTLIGTMGAVIKVKGQIPNRKALFDIGVAGPLAGLVATIIVAVIGLSLPPITVPESVLSDPNAIEVQFGYPPLLQMIAAAIGQPLAFQDPTKAVNPVVFGAWVGMFVTFLNLIPVGQLDGGHILRSIAGERQEAISAFVPGSLFLLAGYLFFVESVSGAVGIWIFWGIITIVLVFAGSVQPIHDDEDIGRTRKTIGLITLILGLLCFTPIPIQIIG